MGAGEAHSARCLLLRVLAMDGTAVDDIKPLGIWRTALVLKGGRYDAVAGIAAENTAECNFCRAFVRGSQRLGCTGRCTHWSYVSNSTPTLQPNGGFLLALPTVGGGGSVLTSDLFACDLPSRFDARGSGLSR